MASSRRVRAIVRVTLLVEADSVWSSDTTWDQIAKQAEDSVRDLFTSDNPITLKDIPRRVRNLEMVEVKVTQEGQGK